MSLLPPRGIVAQQQQLASSAQVEGDKEIVRAPSVSAVTGTTTTGEGSSTGTPKATTRRSSTFYVPLGDQNSAEESLDLSGCSLDWLDESGSSEGAASAEIKSLAHEERVAAADDQQTSTPKKYLAGSRTRTNILNLADRISLSPLKEKSKTLPQSLNSSREVAPLPGKNSVLLKSSPRIPAMGDNHEPLVIPLTAKSPRKSLSFIRRTHSTKVSRSSSLLRSFTLRTSDEGERTEQEPLMIALNAQLLERLFRIREPADFNESLRRVFFKEHKNTSTSLAPTTRGCGYEEYKNSSRPEEEESVRSDHEEEGGIHSGNFCDLLWPPN